MRLAILNNGHSRGTRGLFAVIRTVSGRPVPEILKLFMYRPDIFGTHIRAITHEAMRGTSAWPVADRELMAAWVSKTNRCEFCVRAHTAVAARAYRDEAKVCAALADLDTGVTDERLRATIRMLRKLTHEHSVDVDDMRAVLAAGVTREEIKDALAVCFAFNVLNRVADAFGFLVPEPKVFESVAKLLLVRGYR